MRKTFKLQDLDCANCALKMENSIKELDGVTFVSVSYMTQRLTLEADDKSFDEIMKRVSKLIKKVEPDCRIVF